jgi:hypothetical protein
MSHLRVDRAKVGWGDKSALGILLRHPMIKTIGRPSTLDASRRTVLMSVYIAV